VSALRLVLLGASLAAWPAGAFAAGSEPPLTSAALECVEALCLTVDKEAFDRAGAVAVLRAADPRAELANAAEARQREIEASLAGSTNWPGGIGYARVRGLRKDGAEALTALLDGWERAGLGGAILDLRGAGGDNLDAVRAAAGYFVHGRPVVLRVSAAGDAGEGRPLRATFRSRPFGRPLALLVDGDTRGAAEALALVLRGRRGVVVLGSRTAGDGAARAWVPLAEDWRAYITVQRIASADSTPLAGHGVEPDVPSPGDGAGLDALRLSPAADGGSAGLLRALAPDPVLRRAADSLLGLRAMGGLPAGVDPEAEGGHEAPEPPQGVPDDGAPRGHQA
jgi:hypothetical protein